MTPAGFLISSAEDMVHYLTAQLNSGVYSGARLLSPEGIVALQTPGARIGPLSSYGMGWVIQGEPGSTRIWHNGDASNFHSNLLLLPDQHIGIVTLVNVGGFTNSAAINVPIEGVAAILLGDSLTASTNPPFSVIPQLMLFGMLLIPVLWIIGSYLSIRRWHHRAELPPQGIRRLWRYWLPLVIDLCPLGFVWIIIPAQFHAPMETIALFAPDAFVMIVMVTVLSLGWAIARSLLTLHPRPLMKQASNLA
jgi:hypothetical protein